MTRSELANCLAAQTGMNNAEARRTIDLLFSAIIEATANGEQVTLRGFGTFKVKSMPARNARHPRTGIDIEIPPSRKLTLSAAKSLTQRLSG